jgi:hypothetical protein
MKSVAGAKPGILRDHRQDGDGVVMRQEIGRAVGRRGLQRLRRDLAAGAGLVLDDDRHAQLVLEPLRQDAGDRVGATTRAGSPPSA